MMFENRKELERRLRDAENERDMHMANADARSRTISELRIELEDAKMANDNLKRKVANLEKKLCEAEEESKSFEMLFANENNEATQMNFLLLKYKELNRRVVALEESRKQDLEDRVGELKARINTASMQLTPIAYVSPTYRS